MAYISTVEISVWKEHTCVGCGAAYRYLFRRTKSGRGATPDASGEAAQRAAVRALESEADWHPCPGCGLYQPDMIAAVRVRRHWWAFWALPPLAGALLVLVLTDVVTLGTASWALAALVAACAGCHLLIDRWNPNRDPARNQSLAKSRLEAGELQVPAGLPAESPRQPFVGRVGQGQVVCYLLLVAATLAALAPLGLRRALALPVSPGWHPEVVGAGETAYVYFDQKVTSIKSMWHGSPKVFVWNWWWELDQPSPPQFAATARQDSWGKSISVGSRESRSGSPRLWARVTVPADEALVGQSVDLVIDMPTRWPEPRDDKQWEAKEDTFRHRARLNVAPAGAGRLYTVVWWVSFLGGVAVVSFAGARMAVLAGRQRRQALPPRFFAVDP